MNLLVVTGASSGLGLEIARAAPFEARVVGLSRSAPPDGSGIDHVPADLSSPPAWSEVCDGIARLVEATDPEISVMVHAAGTLSPIGFAGEVDTVEYARNVLLNSAAGQVLGHAYLKAVAGRPGRHALVMITSGAASTAYEGWSAYGAGKAAIDQWVRIVGAEQEIRGGVVVASVAPGLVDTGMQDLIRSTGERDFPRVSRFRDAHRSGELAEPPHVARKLWSLIERGLAPGSVVDLRDL